MLEDSNFSEILVSLKSNSGVLIPLAMRKDDGYLAHYDDNKASEDQLYSIEDSFEKFAFSEISENIGQSE